MGGKRKASQQPMVTVRNADGSTTQLSQGAYALSANLGNQINTGDLSTLDRQELMGRLQESVQGSRTQFVNELGQISDNAFLADGRTPSGKPVESSMVGMTQIQAELGDAIAGQKPKYRYRKYLDQVTALQNDQPGQLQTVLSRGGRGSILGGGAL